MNPSPRSGEGPSAGRNRCATSCRAAGPHNRPPESPDVRNRKRDRPTRHVRTAIGRHPHCAPDRSCCSEVANSPSGGLHCSTCLARSTARTRRNRFRTARASSGRRLVGAAALPMRSNRWAGGDDTCGSPGRRNLPCPIRARKFRAANRHALDATPPPPREGTRYILAFPTPSRRARRCPDVSPGHREEWRWPHGASAYEDARKAGRMACAFRQTSARSCR